MNEQEFAEKIFYGYYLFPSDSSQVMEFVKSKSKQSELLAKFKLDALEVLDLEDHPKADLLFMISWEEGHNKGLFCVWYYMKKLSQLIK